jgi:hypothetical protein
MAKPHRWTSRTLLRNAGTTIAMLSAMLLLAAPTLAKEVKVPLPRPSPAESAHPPTADEGESGDALIDQGDSSQVDMPTSGDMVLDDDTGDMGALGVAPPAADAVPDAGPPADIRPGSFTLEARLAADGPALREGVKWRIFGDAPGSDGKLPLLGQATGGVIYVKLDPGTYYVNAAFSHANATRRIDVTSPTGGEVLVLNAGGLRLLAVNGEDEVLNPADVSFDVSAYDEGGESYVLVHDSPPGHIIGLTAGTYHVVCHYGDANAVVRADIRVDAGKLTEATMYQKAARLTLKLVEQHGGEALANTAWSVVTPGGDNVVESVGAFPSVVLAAGEYRAIAKHDGQVYESNFKVVAGLNRDVEVLLK